MGAQVMWYNLSFLALVHLSYVNLDWLLLQTDDRQFYCYARVPFNWSVVPFGTLSDWFARVNFFSRCDVQPYQSWLGRLNIFPAFDAVHRTCYDLIFSFQLCCLYISLVSATSVLVLIFDGISLILLVLIDCIHSERPQKIAQSKILKL